MGLELNTIYNEDCLGDKELGTGMWRIPDKSVDMILCDLPYGTTQNKWDSIIPLDKLWEQYNRVIKDNGAIILTSAEPFTSVLITSNLKNFRYDLIWEKSHATGFLNARRMPMRKHENICVFYKKLPSYYPILEDKPKENIRPITTKNRLSSNYGNFDEGNHRTIPVDKTYPKSVLKIPNESKTETFHPTQKPVALFEYLINTYTNDNALILDNCMGSATTAIATLNVGGGRKYIGFELDSDYYNKALERIELHRKEIS